MLSKGQILEASDMTTEVVHVPEWDGNVIVKTMTGMERDKFETSLLTEEGGSSMKNMENLRAKMVVMCVVDGDGKRLFGDKDTEALGRKSARAIDRIFTVAQRLNAIGTEDVEELTKN